MRVRSYTAAACVVAAVAVACGGSNLLGPAISARSLRFHQDSGYVLVTHISACTSSGTPYCFEWQHVAADYAGTFASSSLGVATITLDGSEYHAANFHTDSLPNLFHPLSGFCGSVMMRARVAGNTLVGTMEHQTDCHGVTQAGSFRADSP